MTTLITGGRGALGREFVRLLPDALAPSSAELDITDAEAVTRLVHEASVDQVIHCAAMTSVVACENDKRKAFAVNVGGTRNLCAALAGRGADVRMTLISTACVFPGDDPGACYTEDDICHPKNYYALTKLLSETVVTEWMGCAPGRRALIVRTNFAERGPWKHPRAFTDRFGTYLYPDQVAAKVIELMAQDATGVFHVTGDRRLSMYEFARLVDDRVEPMTLEDYSGPPLTQNMSLESRRIASIHLR